MGRYSGILLCSDLDGTLYNGREIPQNNIKAIKHFAENGGMFTPSSGRPINFLRGIFDQIGYSAPLIALNGAHVYDTVKELDVKKTYMSGLTRELLLDIISQNPEITRVNLHTKDGHIKVLPNGMKDMNVSFGTDIFKVTFNIAEYDTEISDRVKSNVVSAVKDAQKDFVTVRSSTRCIEIVDPRNTKEKATRLVADYVCADKLVCVGDFENDIAMVSDADIGYAVANATEPLKAIADRITVSVDEGAIAAIIEEL